jgi:hypothetical protein
MIYALSARFPPRLIPSTGPRKLPRGSKRLDSRFEIQKPWSPPFTPHDIIVRDIQPCNQHHRCIYIRFELGEVEAAAPAGERPPRLSGPPTRPRFLGNVSVVRRAALARAGRARPENAGDFYKCTTAEFC